MVHAVQAPEHRRGMHQHVLQINREIEEDEREREFDPAWPSHGVEKSPAARLRKRAAMPTAAIGGETGSE